MTKLAKRDNSNSAALLDKPQPLGILPTFSFWTFETQRIIAWAFVPLCVAIGFATPFIADALNSAFLLVVLPTLLPLLMLGSVERVVRAKLQARREENAVLPAAKRPKP